MFSTHTELWSSGAPHKIISKNHEKCQTQISRSMCMEKPIGTEGEIRVFDVLDLSNYFGAYVGVHVQIMGAPELRVETVKKNNENIPNTNSQFELYGKNHRNTW
jgi:hypothetical protein